MCLNWFELIGDAEIWSCFIENIYNMFLVNWLAKCCAIGLDDLQHWIYCKSMCAMAIKT